MQSSTKEPHSLDALCASFNGWPDAHSTRNNTLYVVLAIFYKSFSTKKCIIGEVSFFLSFGIAHSSPSVFGTFTAPVSLHIIGLCKAYTIRTVFVFMLQGNCGCQRAGRPLTKGLPQETVSSYGGSKK